MAETLCPTPQTCEICGICGFNFGIWVKGLRGAISKGTFPDVQRRIAQERVPTTPTRYYSGRL